MSHTITLSNARVVLADEVMHGCIHIQDGTIQDVHTGGTSVTSAVDMGGDYVLPGFIEIHTDNFERHLMPRPSTHWPSVPALLAHDAEIAAAGITTVFDALGVGDIDHESLRGADLRGVINAFDVCVAQDILRAEHFFHVRCELPAPNTIELFQPFINHARLRLISLMDHTPGQRQWENVDAARIYYTGKKGWSEDKFQTQLAHSKTIQAKHAVPHREYFVALCREHGIALASHDDTTVSHVQQAHHEGVAICEFPTTLLAAQTARSLGLLTVMGGPNVVRGGSHSGNVAAVELAKHGLLDMLSSDYVPGSLLSAVVMLVESDIMTWPQAVALVSSNPAAACKLPDRGVIAAGMRGDLVQVHVADMSQTAGRGAAPEHLRHGVVRAVWRRGQRVV